jgi:hypothetical protein
MLSVDQFLWLISLPAIVVALRVADFGRRDFQVCTSSVRQRVARKMTSSKTT